MLKLKVAAILCAVIVACALFAQTPPAAPPPGSPAHDETPKNLKILNDLTRPQLLQTMHMMRASLGVRCEFCHVETADGFDFASDAKEEKETAREMIELVQRINATTFEGRTVVSCYTCHQGSERPKSLVPLPQTIPPAEPKVPAGKTAAVAPAAEVLIRAYNKASMPGGGNRVLRGTSLTARGPATFEVVESGHRIVIRTKTPAGEMLQLVDGKKGWIRDSRGTRDMKEDEIARFLETRRGFDLPALDLKAKWRPARSEKVGDREAWRIDNRVSDDLSERYWFDAQTGLLLRSMRIGVSPVGRVPEQVDYSDYRTVNGIQLPFNVQRSLVDVRGSSDRKFEAIELPAEVEESSFSMK